MSDTSQSEIRQRMLAQRLAMPSSTVSHCADRFPLRLKTFPPFKQARHLAAYQAVRNEASPAAILSLAQQLGKTTYLPLVRGETLRFAPVGPDTRYISGKFGIPVPDVAEETLRSAGELDLIIMPMLAFDRLGHRIGMGGGFYDKTLAGSDVKRRTPFLLGLAYSWQRVDTLPANPWDVPLHAALTESALYDFSH
ncbi:5-formyltetrahydrofolate cyclo-ligase [Granulosicoccaceae sp. 1_MG-2023]|nr:5-formyltetrahydrofolate cyclo-ligase [Granulosicoccaceae sp. 1_MG-2023]